MIEREDLECIYFLTEMVAQCNQYTSKHCTDCLMARERTDRTLALVQKRWTGVDFSKLGDAEKVVIKGLCEEIERKCWDSFESNRGRA